MFQEVSLHWHHCWIGHPHRHHYHHRCDDKEMIKLRQESRELMVEKDKFFV